jgi:hypothetical protein
VAICTGTWLTHPTRQRYGTGDFPLGHPRKQLNVIHLQWQYLTYSSLLYGLATGRICMQAGACHHFSPGGYFPAFSFDRKLPSSCCGSLLHC